MDILIKGNMQGIGNVLTIAPENIAFTKITKSSLRLIVNETTGKVLYRHMAHDNITAISYDDEHEEANITFASSVPVMTVTDVFSVKLYVQKEDIIPTDYAKETTAQAAANDAAAAKVAAQGIIGYALQGSDPTATNTAILQAIPSVADLATEANATNNKNEVLAAIAANAGIPTLTIPDSTAAQELAPNVLYIFDTRTSTLTLTLGTPIVGIANEYHFFIVCGSTAPTVNFPSGISWNGGSAPTIAADKTYEVSILNNVAAYFGV